jgi:hypothetical protein
MSAVKREYNSLLEGGELLELYPGLTGIWEKDKKIFTELYILNLEVIEDAKNIWK